MGADEVLQGVSQSPAAYKRQAQAVEFEGFGKQWRTIPRGDGIKKIFFLASLLIAACYYAFLALLIFIR